ncbi:MAG TPA: hypothetical protein VJ386_07395 [Candidatus Deferrimicrobiaceae bacterium]|nr:hypothetical protein [Candidatus Deferrimicrobiaceae bacterium]
MALRRTALWCGAGLAALLGIAAPPLPGWKLSVGAGEVIYEGRPLPLA